jgi:hypothetical protein
MIWVGRGYGVILWLSGVGYLIIGIAQIMLGWIDFHWLLYSGIAALLIGLLLLYASAAAARRVNLNLVLAGNIFSLLILPPLGLVGLALYFIMRREPRAVQCAANQDATSP